MKNSIITSKINGPDIFNLITGNNFTLTYQFSSTFTNESLLLNQLKYVWGYDNISQDSVKIQGQGLSLDVIIDKSKINNTFVLQKSFDIFVYYNNNLVATSNKIVFIKEFQIVPIIQNENNLNFFANNSIFIDASLSYDEMTSLTKMFNQIEDKLIFSWECPFPFNISSQCLGNTSTLSIPNSEYFYLINQQSLFKNQTFRFSLKLSKGDRKIVRIFNVSLLSLSTEIMMNNVVNIVQEGVPINGIITLLAMIQIPTFYEEVYFYWSVDNITNEKELYINGREQHIIKINTNYLSYGKNLIRLNIFKRNNKLDYTEFTYSYNRNIPPSNGTCVVSPKNGISLVTNFTFYALNWYTDLPPLMYNIIFQTTNNLTINLFNSSSFNNILTTNNLPSGKNFMLQVIDKSGNVITSPCEVDVIENKNISLVDITSSISDPVEKLKVNFYLSR